MIVMICSLLSDKFLFHLSAWERAFQDFPGSVHFVASISSHLAPPFLIADAYQESPSSFPDWYKLSDPQNNRAYGLVPHPSGHTPGLSVQVNLHSLHGEAASGSQCIPCRYKVSSLFVRYSIISTVPFSLCFSCFFGGERGKNRKLEVNSATEAVYRARELELIE